MRLKKRHVVVAALVGAIAAVSAVGFAANPHFISGPTCAQTSPTLVTCSGKIAGLGSSPIFLATNAFSGCTTQSGSNNPPGQATFVSGPFNPSNGQFTFGPGTGNNVTASAPNCPGTQTGFVNAGGVTISVYECTSGQPTFSKKTGAQTNPNCTLILGPVATT